MKELVSVILPCYNQGIYLSEALDSLLKQTYTDWEAIVVNDGSQDCTEEIALKFIEKDSRIRYFSQNNKGVSAARNLGAAMSKGKYILPLDPDDYLASDYIEECIGILEKFPEYTLVYTQTYLCGLKDEVWNLPVYSDYKSFLLGNCIVCTSLYRKEDYLRVGGYDEQMHIGLEDWEFYIRLLNGDKKVFQISKPLFFYRIKEMSRTVECNKDDKLKQVFMYVYKKHFELYVDYYGFPLDNMKELFYYKKKCDKYRNRWYRRLWRKLRNRS